MSNLHPHIYLDEVANFANGKALSKSNYNKNGLFPVYGSNGIIAYTNEKSYNNGVTIIGRVGAYCGSLYFSNGPSWVTDNAIVTTGKNGLDNRFIYYLLQTLQLNRTAIGSAQPLLTQGGLKVIKLRIPPINKRSAIQLLLSSIDDKIENNHKINKTLEDMIHTIYKSWFVDFDPVHAKVANNAPAHMNTETAALFPSSFEKDSFPVGWKWSKLGECISFTKGRSYKSAELKDSNTALVTLKSFLRGGGYRSDGLKPYIGTYKDEQILKSGDLITALTDVTQAADVIGKPAIVRSNEKFATLVASLDVGIIRPGTNSLSIPFLYCMMRTYDFQSHIYGYTSGTTVLHLNKDGLLNYEFAMPSKDLLEKFTSVAAPIFSKIEFNENNSITLAKLRDTILPKLMSGEISIKDAEREVETAV